MERSVLRGWRLPKWLRAGCVLFGVLLLVMWATLAIYYAGSGGSWLRLVLAVGFAGFSVWAWGFGRDKVTLRRVWMALFLSVVGWFVCIRPSHDREWRREVAVSPRVTVQGDRVRIGGYRDFEYRSRDDFDARYQEREVDLSHLTSVDLFISYWDDGPMAHTFLSFAFDNAPPVCVSIEARTEKHERFAAMASIFKRFELIYVVGDERDLVRVRTNHRGEQVYLYPIRVSAESARRLFLVYAERINRLADKPEFYHLLANSCTANIVRNAEAAGFKTPLFDGRFILNGLVDRYLYEAGLINDGLPFEELRRRSRITDATKAAGDEDFSRRIRAAHGKTR